MSKPEHKNGYINLSKICRLISASIIAVTLAVGTGGTAHANKKYAAIVVDANNGKILHSRSANSHRYPASLTKMMTVYIIFEDIEKRKISKTSKIKVSKKAARRPASKLWLRPGQTITVEEAIYALVTKSANDVATAVGESLEGSQEAFAKRMTRKAKNLGMRNTTFKNANGLTQRGQKTTAADMAVLGMALRQHFPQHYHYFETRTFKYGRSKIKNHNSLLGNVNGVDGIKTGYTDASGFNLVTSVEENGKSIVAVVMGGTSSKSRDRQMKSLVDKFLKVASRTKPRPVLAKLPSKVAKPAPAPRRIAQATIAKPVIAPREKINNDIAVAQIIESESGAIANKIRQAHEASIGISKIDVSKIAKPITAPRKKINNDIVLAQIIENESGVIASKIRQANELANDKPKIDISKIDASKIAKPITAPRKKISNDVVVAQVNESGVIASKIRQAHEVTIGTSKIDISETIKLAWAEKTRVINNRSLNNKALNAIQNNSSQSQWQIQVTATNSKERAQEFIKEVRNKNKDILRNIKDTTKSVTLKDGKKLYRARFIGFTNKQNAQNACKELIKNKFQCMILKV